MKKSPIKKFRINRKEWMRFQKGKHTDFSYEAELLDCKGMKCCLGFYSLARGINKKYIENKYEPSDLVKENEAYMLPELCSLNGNSKIANRLMEINDNENTSDEQKEKAIKNNFKKLGVEVEFYN